MSQPAQGPTTAGVTHGDARGAGPARLLALAAAGLAVLFYLLGFLGDVGITTGEVGILIIGGGFLVGASVLPQVGRVLLPGAVAVVVGMLVLLQIVASGGSSGLLVGALVVAFLETLAAVAAFLLDVGLVAVPVPRVAPPSYGQPPTQHWAGQPGPGAGAWPGAAQGRPGPGPSARPPTGPQAPGQFGPPPPDGAAAGRPPLHQPPAAGQPGSWLPSAGPAGDPSATAVYERPFGPAAGGSAPPSEATAVFALPPSVASDAVTSPAGHDTARIGTPATPAWGQPAIGDPALSPTSGDDGAQGTDGRDEPAGDRADVRPPAPGERPAN